MSVDTELRKAIGYRVHSYRLEQHYTQAELAELMDISINFLSDIENGKKGMSQETLYKLCKNCNLSADYILFGETFTGKSSNVKALIETANHLSDDDLVLLINYLNALKGIRSIAIQRTVSEDSPDN